MSKMDTQYGIRDTLHASRNCPLHLSRNLYKSALFMQNEPNFKNAQIYTCTCITSSYGIFRLLFRRKNEAKRTQNEPNFGPKLASFFPIKANSNPNQTQFHPNGRFQQNKLRNILEKLYKKYNHRQFIPPDPLQFVYKYKSKKDKEIAGLLSASLAYGRVEQIENDLIKLFSMMGESPYEFTITFNNNKRKKLSKFKHRFNTGDDISDLLWVLKIALKNHSSIESFFVEGYNPNDKNIIPALTNFCDRLYPLYEKNFCRPASKGFKYLLANPANGSVCKRLNMFLRWMVRSDDVDTGLWRTIDKSKLIVPVDTHMARLCKILGLYSRKTLSLAAAIEITESFKRIAPADPVKYDFALSRIGIIENCTGKIRKKCEACELLEFCNKAK